MATMNLGLSINDIALTVCFTGQPCLADLVSQKAWVQDPEVNGCHIAVPHTALWTGTDPLNPRGPMLHG